MTEHGAAPPEPLAAVPASELRKLADLLVQLDIDLADDLVAGLANRVLRDLTRRWADTVSVWVVEAELWGAAASVEHLSDTELSDLIRTAVGRLAGRQARPPADVWRDIIGEGG